MTTRDDLAESGSDSGSTTAPPTFADDLAANRAVEKRLIWKEAAALAIVAAIAVARRLWLS